MRIKLPVLAAIAVVAGLLTACDGDDRPVTLPTGIALPSGAAEPAAPPGEDADIPAMTPVPATPAPQPGGATSAATTPAAPATPAETTPPAASDGSGHGLCLDPNSELVASAIAGLEQDPDGQPWRIREASEDPIADGCDDLLSYVAVEWPYGMHPAVHLLFFSEGRFLGTGSEEPYQYTTVLDKSVATVSVEYRWPLDEDPLCCPQGSTLVVYYLSADGLLTVHGDFPPHS
ncbi:MAG TPA: LppP/LprE family lipoprotein [Nocardia sp.]|uniref:LppP/LprE family lipoprotein n=1 Tax=Nocardia sp. TaxID=1821 RepID=UPI002B4B6F85|nr:LppP/LprE family lipoprotein [Nocardia sp.]HLS78770.1 LppP/LprE family lipoprotein [Nocardia sp.]